VNALFKNSKAKFFKTNKYRKKKKKKGKKMIHSIWYAVVVFCSKMNQLMDRKRENENQMAGGLNEMKIFR